MRHLALVITVAVLTAVGVVPAAAAPSTGAMSGSVQLSTGAFLANVPLEIRATKGGENYATIYTDAGGSFVADAVVPGTYWLRAFVSGAVAPDHVRVQVFEDADGWIPVVVDAGVMTTGVDIVVAAAGSVSGTVTYDASASAVASARPAGIVVLRFDDYGFASPVYGSLTHSADGTFTLSGLKPGEYTLRFADATAHRVITEYYGDSPWLSTAETFTIAAGDALTGFDAVIGAGEHEPQEVFRYDGEDRFEAAVALSANTIPDGEDVPVVYIVNGLGFADALSAGPAASYEGGVLLTVRPTGIPPVVKEELERLDPDRIVIVGGPASVSEAVRAQLQLIAPSTRIDGTDRFEVSRNVAATVWDDFGTAEAFMVTGYNFPDALSAGSVAATRGAPVVLIASTTSLGASPLDSATRSLLVELGAGEVHIVGGTASVNSRIESDLIAMPQLYLVDRFGGEDRFEASSNLAAAFPQADARFLATGYNYPDALAGSWLAGLAGGAVILIPGTCIPSAAAALLDGVRFVGILGGTSSVTPAVENGTVC